MIEYLNILITEIYKIFLLIIPILTLIFSDGVLRLAEVTSILNDTISP